MRRLIAVALLAWVSSPVWAQVHNIPPSVFIQPGQSLSGTPLPSVTSIGPGQPFSAAPLPSVTSIGPRYWAPVPYSPYYFHHQFGKGFSHDGRWNRQGDGLVFVPFYTPVPVYPLTDPMYGAPDMAQNDNGSETAPEPPAAYTARRETQAEEPAPAATYTPADPAANAPAAPAPSAPSVPEQQATILVFRDGHRLEVRNYAIVGSLIYNYSGSGPRKIPLADLDLEATNRLNDDRGVEFRVPRVGD